MPTFSTLSMGEARARCHRSLAFRGSDRCRQTGNPLPRPLIAAVAGQAAECLS